MSSHVEVSSHGIGKNIICVPAPKSYDRFRKGRQPWFGRAGGGVFNVVTKSGSNDLHGTLLWRYQSQRFNSIGSRPARQAEPDIGAGIAGRIEAGSPAERFLPAAAAGAHLLMGGSQTAPGLAEI